ncbi:MAG: hypothetical protein ACRD3G_08550 [Vicinamibacterales bacterium]
MGTAVASFGLLIALLAQTSLQTPPQSLPPAAPPHKTARFSFYPIRLYDLSPQAGVFAADFYVWLSFRKGEWGSAAADSVPKLEAANGEELQCEVVEYDSPESPDTQTFWYRCRSKFYHSFDFTFYPFDEQTLNIELENPAYPQAQFSFTVMTPASHLEECRAEPCLLKSAAYPSVSGWEIASAEVRTRNHHYNTDWGFPKDRNMSDYSQAILQIRLLHRWGVPLLALLGPNLLVALLATSLAGSAQEKSGRMQALLGVIAAAAAQHYSFLNNAPGDSAISFAQLYFLITYALLALAGWFILTRDTPLPPKYQARWFFGYGILQAVCLVMHIAVPMFQRGEFGRL